MLGASCRNPLERRAIVRQALDLVKRETTTYCALYFGQLQYIANYPTNRQFRSYALSGGAMAGALAPDQVSGERRRFVGKRRSKEEVAGGKRLFCLL